MHRSLRYCTFYAALKLLLVEKVRKKTFIHYLSPLVICTDLYVANVGGLPNGICVYKEGLTSSVGFEGGRLTVQSITRDRERDRQTDKQTDRQTNKQTDRQTNRQTDRQTDKQIG